MSAWLPSRGLLAAAAGILLGAALAWWWWEPDAGSPARATTAATPATPAAVSTPAPENPDARAGVPAPPIAAAVPPAAVAMPAAPRPILRVREPGDDPSPDIADYVNEGEQPTMPEVIQRLRQAGVEGGLAAFPPPGTRPPLIGLAVPEDFPLPDGYVRHHQATDDGQRIEAILMFAPDRQFTDAAGQPIAIPDNRVVPPELAPPGLPLRRIVLPPPADAGRPGS